MFANTITQRSSSGNHTNKHGLCTPLCKVHGSINNGRLVGGNNDDNVHVGESLPTVILRCDVPYANSLSAIVGRLWASPNTMDVPSGTVPQNIERLRTATRATGGLHGKRLHHGRGVWILHKVHAKL